MTDAARDAAIGALLLQMRQMRMLRGKRGLAGRVAAASLLMLRGPLREIDDRRCGMPLAMLRGLARAGAGVAGVN